jgi:hypothetical protein
LFLRSRKYDRGSRGTFIPDLDHGSGFVSHPGSGSATLLKIFPYLGWMTELMAQAEKGISTFSENFMSLKREIISTDTVLEMFYM